jgi:hypothetical protein
VTDAAETDPTHNPFDPASRRLDQSFADTVGVKKLLTTVPVCKPNRTWYVRVHPDLNYRLTPAAIIDEDREFFLVTPQMALECPDEITPVTLFTAINRQGVLFLWPVRLPGLNGKYSEWFRSAMEAAEIAQRRWIRVRSNMSLGAYETLKHQSSLPSQNGLMLRLPKSSRLRFATGLLIGPTTRYCCGGSGSSSHDRSVGLLHAERCGRPSQSAGYFAASQYLSAQGGWVQYA